MTTSKDDDCTHRALRRRQRGLPPPVEVNVTSGTGIPAPVLADAGSLAFSIAENLGEGTFVGAFSASTPREGAHITFSISGGDADRFAVDSSTGILTLAGPLDYEGGAKSFTGLSVVAFDGTRWSAEAPFTVDVTNVNEAPTLQTPPSWSVAENTPPGTNLSCAQGADEDEEDELTYAFSAGVLASGPTTGA